MLHTINTTGVMYYIFTGSACRVWTRLRMQQTCWYIQV